MDGFLIALCLISAFLAYKIIASTRKQEGYKRWKAQGKNLQSIFVKPRVLKFDDEAIIWCARLLGTEEGILRNTLENIPLKYHQFWIGKRSGGYRMISAPREPLKTMQDTIYRRILLPANIHPAAAGFRPQHSIVDNASPHLGNLCVLKTDIHAFFDSIRSIRVRKTFEQMGYPKNISKVLGTLCCAYRKLPQGASSSPALSNIVAYNIDRKLAALATEHGLVYTRYADDLTFSGSDFTKEQILPQIERILRAEGFKLNRKKTRFMGAGKRKIITGVSVSSGKKLTIPKARKREIRKNVHFILTKGLAEHQRYIGSKDPAYLKRLIGMLCYWRSIEPDNAYVSGAIRSLKQLQDI